MPDLPFTFALYKLYMRTLSILCVLDQTYFIFRIEIYIKSMDKFGLRNLGNQKDAREQAETFSLYINQNGQFNKGNANELLDSINTHLNSQASPVSKTMTLHLLKQLTYQAEVKFFSLLSTHKLLDFLTNEAKSIDPKKSVNQKGLKKFPGAPELGKQYMRVLLELTNFWGEKFAKGKNSEQTKFKKNFTQLKNAGVTFPPNYEVFDTNQYKMRSKTRKQGTMPPSSTTTPTGNQPPTSKISANHQSHMGKPAAKLSTQLKFTKDRISLFVADLQQIDDPQKLQAIIKKNHQFFDKQRAKYQARVNQVEQEQEAVADYFSVQHFLNEENKFYNMYAPVNDLSSYISQVKMLSQTTFQNNNLNANTKSTPQRSNPPQSKTNVMERSQTRPFQTSQPPLPPAQSQTLGSKASTDGLNNGMSLISGLYSKLEERTKSPNTGFKVVQMELEKQKEIAKKNPMRSTSRSPRNMNRSGLNKSNASGLRESKIHPIFATPPNNSVPYKSYQGQILLQNKELAQALYSIKKDQGSRRFITSNFRQKNPLFQNQQIQVGYKSQPIYEPIGQFNRFIMLNIFIGNKTEQGIKDFQVEYKADSNQLLYANPRNVDSIIPGGYQNKHDLMITPISLPYSLMTMHISYKFKNTGYMTSIVLPNSVLKFASYMKIGRADFQNNWRNSRKFRTNPFKLSKHLPPDTFQKWIPTLEYLTKYQDFSREGSQTDLQLYCMVIMLQKQEAVLKINIRPNLDVILQVGVIDDSSQDGMNYFRFYLESLELMLKDFNV